MHKIVVIGAGAFGTALALTFCKNGHQVTLKPRRLEQALALQTDRCNRAYLDDVIFPNTLIITVDHSCLLTADLIILATPTQHTATIISELKPFISTHASFIIASKGIIELNTVKSPFIVNWINAQFPDNPTYILSGPNFAKEIANDLPAAATLAGTDEIATRHLATKLRHSKYLLYPSTDTIGVSLAGAIKNVYAIAAGMCHGLSLGQNALAALITRALAETKRLGLMMGADSETFLGLSGVGDLMLTCSSPMSRNMSLGMELASGKTLTAIMAERNTIAEGVSTSKALAPLIQHYGVRMPIADAVYKVLHENADIKQVLFNLLNRDAVPLEVD